MSTETLIMLRSSDQLSLGSAHPLSTTSARGHLWATTHRKPGRYPVQSASC